MEYRESENHFDQERAREASLDPMPQESSALEPAEMPSESIAPRVFSAQPLAEQAESDHPGLLPSQSASSEIEGHSLQAADNRPVSVSRGLRMAAFALGLILIVGTLCFAYKLLMIPPASRMVVLYFSDFKHQKTVPVQRKIPRIQKKAALLHRLMLELYYGPLSNDKLPSLPPGTTLLGSWYRDGIAYVDFSRELFLGLPVEGGAELVAFRAILATIRENMPAVRQVQILVNGRVRRTLRGLTRIDRPVAVQGRKGH